MIRRLTVLCLAVAALAAPSRAETLSSGAIDNATIYRPDGTPKALVLFLSGDGGWNMGVLEMAQILAKQGAAVAGVDTPALLHALDQQDGACDDLGGELKRFAAAMRPQLGVPDEAPLVVAGYSSGATLVYLAQASAEGGAVKGGVALGFCPDLITHKPICLGDDLTPARDGALGFVYPPQTKGLPGFTALQGLQDKVCDPPATIAFVEKMPGAKVVQLPKVGHGFGVEKNWEPQYLAAYHEIVGDTP